MISIPSYLLSRLASLDKVSSSMDLGRFFVGLSIALSLFIPPSRSLCNPLFSSDSLTIQSHESSGIGEATLDPRNPIRVLFGGKRLDLWSLEPIQDVDPPSSDIPNAPSETGIEPDHLWPMNPIDSFLLEDWSKQRTVPQTDISTSELIRRIYLETIGIPPQPDEMNEWQNSLDESRYQELVDSLLASPRYGEHWGRMWLDVVRYSDSNGFDWDEFRPEAWRYRDYVIRAWNSNKPFDLFTIEQLAGDEMIPIPPRTESELQSLIGTGYLRLGPFDSAAKLFNEQDRARAEVLADLTETTASAWLGLTLACCRCHDHKTDPLSHADHYRFRAFFAATHFGDAISIDLAEEQDQKEKSNLELETQIESIRNSRLSRLNEWATAFGIEKQPLESDAKDTQKKWEKKIVGKLNSEQKSELDEFEQQINSIKQKIIQPTIGLLMTDNRESVDTISILEAGDHRRPLNMVQAGFPSVVDPNEPQWVLPTNPNTTGKRLTLAKWITSDQNRWTARVIVNRLWQNWFGKGIVETANDFGMTGSPPSHRELLDYLAMELIRNDWSIKHIQRLILTSHAYRMKVVSGVVREKNEHGDWIASTRTGARRLTAEQLRDALLSAADLIQFPAGGTPTWPELSDDILQANPAVLDDNETKTKGWYPSKASLQTVRSIYLIQKRTLRLPWMETFDQPENATSCPKRETSIVAPQALAMLNGELTTNAAMKLAPLIRSNAESEIQQVEIAFSRLLGRPPTVNETRDSLDFLSSQSLEEFIHVLFNTNEFAFVP